MKKYTLLSFFYVIATLANPIKLITPKTCWTSFFKTIQQTYPIDTFIESGTYKGETTLISADFFDNVYTVEVNEAFFNIANKKLKNHPNVKMFLGDTANLFPTILQTLKKNKILFWLDGHFMSSMIGEHDDVLTEYGYTPILKELNAITSNNIQNAIILIDDIRLFGTTLANKRISNAGNKDYPLINDIVHYLAQYNYQSVIFGDMLFSYHKDIKLSFSALIQACTISRLYDGNNFSIEAILNAEQIIAKAGPEESSALFDLYKEFSMPWRRLRSKSPYDNLWRNKSPHYNLWYGLLLQTNGEHKKACKQFEEIIQLGYSHWRIHWYLAKSLLEINKTEKAAVLINQVIKETVDETLPTSLTSQLRKP